jgi:hypothetical protein
MVSIPELHFYVSGKLAKAKGKSYFGIPPPSNPVQKWGGLPQTSRFCCSLALIEVRKSAAVAALGTLLSVLD